MRLSVCKFLFTVLALPHDLLVRLYGAFAAVWGPFGLALLNGLMRLVLAANVALDAVTLLNLEELLSHELRGSWVAALLLLNYLCWSTILALWRVLLDHHYFGRSQRDRR